MKLKNLLSFFCLIATVVAKDLPSGITPCHRQAEDFSTCVENAFREGLKIFKDGYKDFDIPPLDPTLIPELKLVQSQTNKNFRLSLVYHNSTLKGLTELKFSSVSAETNGDEMTLKVKVLFPYVDMTGQYEMIGKLLLFTIHGKDSYVLKLDEVSGDLTMVLSPQDVGGVKYYTVKSTEFAAQPFKVITIQYNNIIKGNDQMSAEVNKALKDNFTTVREIFSTSVNEFFASLVSNVATKVFAKVPMDAIMPP